MLLLPWITVATWTSLSLIVPGHKVGPIQCECTTSLCIQQEMHLCTTEGLCFTQYLDRGVGGPSLVRGCIGGRTPLLCENRKPSKAKTWPVLYCCNTDLCNRGTVPTPPSWHGDDLAKDVNNFKNLGVSSMTSNHSNVQPVQLSPPVPESSASSFVQKNSWPHIISPIYVSVLVLGIVSLVIIGIVAATVIRRNNRFYAEHYGALEFQQGKETHSHCDFDSEIESVASSQPYLHVVCTNRNT